MAALYDSLNAMFTQIATDVKLLFSSKANKTGGIFTGPITVSDANEAQVHVDVTNLPTAYLYSNASDWGLWSPAGGMIVGYNRATQKILVGGIDTSEIVRNNAGTYNINISASAAKLNGQTASYYTDIPARLGFTPIQQGTGVGQSGNIVKIGWSASSKLKATVDSGDLGNFAFESWVSQQIANLVASSPAALDTLNELATALGNDPNFATTVTNALAGKINKTGGSFTGLVDITLPGEANLTLNAGGNSPVTLYSSNTDWGLYSGTGGSLINYNRASGRSFIAGIDTSEIVKNNYGTYNLSIAGSAANLVINNDYQVGSLGVGTIPSGSPGSIRATGDIIGLFSSDKRLKENIVCIQNPLEVINAINGVRFNWTQKYIDENGGLDEYFFRREDIGVIADEIEKVLPEIVSIKPNGYKAVKYDRIVAVLIEGIKQLTKQDKEKDIEILELKRTVEVLFEKIKNIESRLS